MLFLLANCKFLGDTFLDKCLDWGGGGRGGGGGAGVNRLGRMMSRLPEKQVDNCRHGAEHDNIAIPKYII